jgi:hypothetical protein
MAQVAILIPLMRPHRIRPVVDSIAATTADYRVVVVATGECADAARELPVTLIEDEGGTYPARINLAFRSTDEPYVMLAADDLVFRAGWLFAAMELMQDINGVVGINGLLGSEPVHYLVSREYINSVGGTGDGIPGVVLHEGYQHCFCDTEFMRVAQFRDRFAYATESIVEHLHYIPGKAPMDATYALGDSTMSQGSQLFASRQHLWQ